MAIIFRSRVDNSRSGTDSFTLSETGEILEAKAGLKGFYFSYKSGKDHHVRAFEANITDANVDRKNGNFSYKYKCNIWDDSKNHADTVRLRVLVLSEIII